MLKIVEIAKAWITAANPTPEQKLIAESRAKTCDTCPKKAFNNSLDIYYCAECGCPLSKKIFSPLPGVEACPDKRWKK